MGPVDQQGEETTSSMEAKVISEDTNVKETTKEPVEPELKEEPELEKTKTSDETQTTGEETTGENDSDDTHSWAAGEVRNLLSLSHGEMMADSLALWCVHRTTHDAVAHSLYSFISRTSLVLTIVPRSCN